MSCKLAIFLDFELSEFFFIVPLFMTVLFSLHFFSFTRSLRFDRRHFFIDFFRFLGLVLLDLLFSNLSIKLASCFLRFRKDGLSSRQKMFILKASKGCKLFNTSKHSFFSSFKTLQNFRRFVCSKQWDFCC